MRMSVKEYAQLIGKNEKTVYKMIKDEAVSTVKENGKYCVTVDKNLLKVIERAQQALNEAKAILLSIEAASDKIKKPAKTISKSVKTVAKKSAPKKFETSGLTIKALYNDVAGSAYSSDHTEFAIVAVKS